MSAIIFIDSVYKHRKEKYFEKIYIDTMRDRIPVVRLFNCEKVFNVSGRDDIYIIYI